MIRQENAWGDKEGSNEVYISEWQEFLQTVYAQKSVPDWNNKLEDIQEFTNEETCDEPNQPSHSQEEWMILADLSFNTSKSMEEEQIQHDWHTSFPYTHQQISEMPSRLTKQKQIFTTHCQSNVDEVDIATFNSMQSLAYDTAPLKGNLPPSHEMCAIRLNRYVNRLNTLVVRLRSVCKCFSCPFNGKALVSVFPFAVTYLN